MKKPLLYDGYSITFQEVPNEISLVLQVTGCPYKCRGCHSSYLQDYHGDLLSTGLIGLLESYKSMITCVCFMGGDQNLKELCTLLDVCHNDYHLKTCLYTGSEEIHIQLLDRLDYVKLGQYIEELGGLDSPTTNQVMYKIENRTPININYLFKKVDKHNPECYNGDKSEVGNVFNR